MRQMIKLQDRLTPPVLWRWPLSVFACLLSGLVWAELALLVESQSIRRALAGLALHRTWFTALFFGLVVLALTFFLHCLFLGNLITGLACMILSFVNYFKVLITMTPLLLGDFALIGQATQIANLNSASLVLRRNSWLAIGAGVVWLLLCLFFARPLRVNWEWSAMLCAPLCVLAFYTIFWTHSEPLVFSVMGASTEMAMSQAAANSTCGVPLGLWRSLYVSLHPKTLEDYSLEYMEQVLAQAEDYTGNRRLEAREQPNVILVLSESFFDITQLEGLSFQDDPLKEYHALQKESVSGTFGTRSFGYGTCDIELEVLTGMNSGLLDNEPLNSWPKEYFTRLPTVPNLLRDSGYYTSMIHMYNDSVYNRGAYFASLGFSDIYFCEDFAKFYPPAAEAEDYNEFMQGHFSGMYFSDDLMADLLISQFETKTAAGEGPVFLYASSMENHTPYPLEKYSPEEINVEPISDLTGEAAEHILICAQGLNNASESLGKLVDYFRTREEPVILVFYGDHRSGLGLSTGGTSYSAMGLVPWVLEDWGVEDFVRFHATDYLIWSNDPSYLPGEPGSRYDTGCHYLGARLLELTGTDMPLYWRLIDKLSQTRVIDSANYHLSRDGVLSADLPDQGTDGLGLSLLTDILYDATYGEQYVTDKLWGYP